MDEPVILVMRETPSLADSLQLLLETVGFRVVAEDDVGGALARLGQAGDAPVRAVVIACNHPRSELLRHFPEAFPQSARGLPVLVIGDRAAHSRHGWPSNVHFIRLPLEGRQLLEVLDHLTAPSALGPVAAEPAPSNDGGRA